MVANMAFTAFATGLLWSKHNFASYLHCANLMQIHFFVQWKIALMKRYDLTEAGYRRKFRVSTPETDKNPDQFLVRLSTYLIRRLELSKTEKTFEGLNDLIVKEQFINSCPKELETLEEMAKIADQHLRRMESTCLVPHGTSRLHYRRRKTLKCL